METPIKFTGQLLSNEAAYPAGQFEGRHPGQGSTPAESGKNLLLTPFLLSLPVIMILIILISGSTSPMKHTVTNESLQRATYSTSKNIAPATDLTAVATDTTAHHGTPQPGAYHAKK